MALYDQETVRNKGQTSYSRLKTSVRLYIDQKMRRRKLKARNEMIDRGVVTRSRERNQANVERKVRVCWQWRATGQCSKGDSMCFSNMRLQLRETDLANLKNKKNDCPLPHQIRRQQKTEKVSPNHLTKNMKVLLIMGAKWKNCTNPSCSYRHPPVCQNYISETGCRCGRSCAISDMLSWRRGPTRSRRKDGAQGNVIRQKGDGSIFPFADGTAKLSVRDYEFRDPTLRRENVARCR